MPVIEVSKFIKQDRRNIFELFKNMQEFPNFMREVKNIKVTKTKENNKLITEWNIEIDGAPMRWKEQDIFDDEQMTLKFISIKGDFKEYSGEWKLEQFSKGTLLKLLVKIDWGMPAFEKFVGPTLEKIARRLLKSMLNAIKKRMENG